MATDEHLSPEVRPPHVAVGGRTAEQWRANAVYWHGQAQEARVLRARVEALADLWNGAGNVIPEQSYRSMAAALRALLLGLQQSAPNRRERT